jgi:large subunit ribosomal protein L25
MFNQYYLYAEITMAELKARKRPSNATGTSEANRLRKQMLVPGIVYGGKQEPQTVSVELRHILKKVELEQFHNLDLKFEDGNSINVNIRELQWHPVRNEVIHIDFIRNA